MLTPSVSWIQIHDPSAQEVEDNKILDSKATMTGALS
jgi:hypothetical protein